MAAPHRLLHNTPHTQAGAGPLSPSRPTPVDGTIMTTCLSLKSGNAALAASTMPSTGSAVVSPFSAPPPHAEHAHLTAAELAPPHLIRPPHHNSDRYAGRLDHGTMLTGAARNAHSTHSSWQTLLHDIGARGVPDMMHM